MSAIRLTRANEDVKSFFSVLGRLRETRLTAILGFMISRFPAEFGFVLGFQSASGDEISVEETDAGERYDVLIRQSGDLHIIEGKIGPQQNVTQLLRYIRKCHRGRRPSLTVVDDGSEFRQSQQRAFRQVRRKVKQLKFVTWTQVAGVCRRIHQSARNRKMDPAGALLAQEFAAHLEENNMTTETQPEIYLRDVSSIPSVELFFRHRIYKCQSNYFNSARRNLYFAPYFTGPMAEMVSAANLVPVGEGISFVSRVKKVQVVERQDVLEYLKANRHPEPKKAAELICRGHRMREVLLMTLGEPRLMFVSPVTKAKLRRAGFSFGQGAMGSRSCAFDDLLAASQS